ncbi:MAG: helix-turn-helix domain-containing protein [Clostridia bacterium]|nr:helix-turn-helix domain-containing protein [Clostridia bacterium]
MSLDYGDMIFANNLRRLLEEKGKKSVDLAKAIGVSKQTVSEWINGGRFPRMDKVDKMCIYLNCTRSDLMEEKKEPTALSSATGFVKLYDGIPCGAPAFIDEQVKGFLPTLLPHPENYAAIRVHGDSMIGAGITDGCTVMIKKQSYAEDGQIVACRINNEEVTLKRFRQQGETIFLMPENPNYTPVIVPVSDFDNGTAQILGVLKQIIIEY